MKRVLITHIIGIGDDGACVVPSFQILFCAKPENAEH